MCILKEAHVGCPWAYWDEKKSQYTKFERDGVAFKVPFSVFYVSLTKTWDLLVVFIVACRGYSYLVFLICFPELLKKEMLVFKHFVCPHIVFFLCSFLIGLNYKIIEIYVHIFGVVIRPKMYFLFLGSNTWLLMNTEILLR